jgi:hypothetical protein
MMVDLYIKLENKILIEFKDIVISTKILRRKSYGASKLRLYLVDETFMDIWISETGKFSFHWEQRKKRGLIHRHDNAPDFPNIKTFPKHFHNGEEENVKESHINDNPEIGIKQFLEFIRDKIKEVSEKDA